VESGALARAEAGSVEGWKRSVAQVLGGLGEVRGVGFLLCGDAKLFVTCAHVVQLALGSIPAEGSAGPEVRFLGAGEGDRVATTIRRADPKSDICVLELTSRPREVGDGLAIELGDGLKSRRAMACGFPHGGREVVDPAIVFVAEVEADGLPLWQLDAHNLTAGFSGGPLIEESTSRVLGIAKEIMRQDENGKLAGVAYGIPNRSLLRVVDPSVLVASWERAFMAPARLAEVLPVVPVVYPKLRSLGQTLAQDASEGDRPLLHATQDYLAGVLSATRFAGLYGPARSSFDMRRFAKSLRAGQVAVFLGTRFFADLGLVFSSESVARDLDVRLAAEGGKRPGSPGNLPRVSHFWQLSRGRSSLREALLDVIAGREASLQPVQDILKATLGRAKSLLVVTTFYDQWLEATLSHALRRVQVITQTSTDGRMRDANLIADARLGPVHVVDFDEGQSTGRRYIPSLSEHQPLERGVSLVYRVCGGAAFESAEGRTTDPDTFVVAEPDYFEFVQQNQRVMPEYVVRHLKNKSLLFLGVDLSLWQESLMLHWAIQQLKGSRELLQAVHASGEPYDLAFWDAAGVSVVATDLMPFLREVRDALEA
jgi:hypothetical protein